MRRTSRPPDRPGRALRVAPALMLAGAAAFAPAGAAATAVPDPAALPVMAEVPRWSWPVAAPHTITRAFQAPATRFSAGHRGLDLAAQPGDAVMAPAGGVVFFAGQVVDRPVLSISHEGGYLSSFEPVDTALAVGQHVTAGQRVGAVATPSHCTSGCLHFGVRHDGEYVSPLLLLAGIPRAVLLPLGDRAAP